MFSVKKNSFILPPMKVSNPLRLLPQHSSNERYYFIGETFRKKETIFLHIHHPKVARLHLHPLPKHPPNIYACNLQGTPPLHAQSHL